jgi:hypothetical protein
MSTTFRPILIVCAYIASAFTASIATFGGTILFSVLSGQRILTKGGDELQWLGALALLTALFALLPALTAIAIAIAIAEVFRIRSLLAHIAVSAAIGATILAVAEIRSPWFFHGPESIINAMRVLWIIGSVIGGMTYWSIAGRRAGKWKSV